MRYDLLCIFLRDLVSDKYIIYFRNPKSCKCYIDVKEYQKRSLLSTIEFWLHILTN